MWLLPVRSPFPRHPGTDKETTMWLSSRILFTAKCSGLNSASFTSHWKANQRCEFSFLRFVHCKIPTFPLSLEAFGLLFTRFTYNPIRRNLKLWSEWNGTKEQSTKVKWMKRNVIGFLLCLSLKYKWNKVECVIVNEKAQENTHYIIFRDLSCVHLCSFHFKVYFVLQERITLQINQMKSTKTTTQFRLSDCKGLSCLHPSCSGSLCPNLTDASLVSFTFNSLFIYKRMKEAREMNKERTQHQSHTAAVTFWNSLKAQVKEEKWSERVRNERRERHTPFTSFPSFHFAFHLIGCYCGPCFVVFKLKRKESTHSFLTCLSFAFI